MSVLLSDLETKVLNLLQKSPSYSGFYTQPKVIQIINECLDYVSARMMQEGNGWLQTIGYITTVANTPNYALPTGCAIVRSVRYLVNTIYAPLQPDGQEREAFLSSDFQTQIPSRYRLVGGDIYFNPVPSLVGVNYLQIEYTGYPSELVNLGDAVVSQFERGLIHYVTYRAASILASTVGKADADWLKYESQWYKAMENIISRRNSTVQFVRSFEC